MIPYDRVDFMKLYYTLLLSLFLSSNASAFCEAQTPRIILDAETGVVRYITHLSKNEFAKRSPVPVSPNTLGLTVAKLNMTGTGIPYLKQNGMRACVGISELRLKIGYDTLNVFIDKKYKPGSCEYAVVKEHENYHVRVSQEAMTFFRPDIEKALNKAVQKIKPQVVVGQAEAQAVFQRQFNQVMRDVQPVLDHINKKIAEKNYEIDTPESYRKTTALCQNW